MSAMAVQTAVIFFHRSVTLRWFPEIVKLLTDLGFEVTGVARHKISAADASRLGLNLPLKGTTKKWDGFAWRVSKENATHFAQVLLEDERRLLAQVGIDGSLAYAAPMSAALAAVIDKLEETPSNDLISRRMHKQGHVLQSWALATPYAVVVSVFPRRIATCASWLAELISPSTPTTSTSSPLRLVATKWLSHVRSHQAKELTPYEVGDAGYKSNVAQLQGSSVQLLVLHGFNAFDRTKVLCLTVSDVTVGLE